MEKNNLVVNASKGYGYSYASLGDIAKQGFTLPKMKTGTEGEREYIYYFDTEIKEWIRGAEIVVPDSKGMNKAQLYGSALTYARRYTALLALQLACDDDKKLETEAPVTNESGNLKVLADEFRTLYSQEDQKRILEGLKLKKAEEIGIVDLQKYVTYAKKKQADNG